MKALTVRVPGKLLLAGEYAVLEPGSMALVLAVDRYVYADLAPGGHYSLSSALAPDWSYTPETLNQSAFPAPLGFAVAALRLGWQYLGERLQARGPFALRLESELDSDGRKLGLGSSAAVCVAVLAGLLAAVGEDLSSPETRSRLFRLALIAHRGVQGSGSGADLAACIHGTVTAYACPDFERLPWQTPLEKLVSMDWPLLGVEKLHWPESWEGRLRFGWVGAPAGTAALIEDYRAWQREAPEDFQAFLFDSAANCLGLREAIGLSDEAAFAHGLGRARRLLQRMGADWPEPPETPQLAALAQAAETLGGAAKLSGAGGGDCGLAWIAADQAEPLAAAWQVQGIEPLSLNLDRHGVKLLDGAA